MRPSRRVIALLVLLPLVVALAVVASAWEAGPTPDDLQARVASRAKQSGARAIPLARIAPAFLDAVVATEDERFYRHQGVDVVGVLRAVPYDVAHLSFAQGASTIPEQLAKLLYLDGNDHSLWPRFEPR